MILYMLSEMTKDYFLSASRAIHARLSNSDEENNVDCVTFFHPLVFRRVNIASLVLVLSPKLLEIVFGRGRKMIQWKRPLKILMRRVKLHIIPCFVERKKPCPATNFSLFTVQLKTCQYENIASPLSSTLLEVVVSKGFLSLPSSQIMFGEVEVFIWLISQKTSAFPCDLDFKIKLRW
jgi:hypothetical protein